MLGSSAIHKMLKKKKKENIESLEINPCIYIVKNQLIFDESAKTIQRMVLGQLDIHKQKNEVGPILHTIYKN